MMLSSVEKDPMAAKGLLRHSSVVTTQSTLSRTHPLLLHAELGPQHEEDDDEGDEPAHVRRYCAERHAAAPWVSSGPASRPTSGAPRP
jgi:hypothetical protein